MKINELPNFLTHPYDQVVCTNKYELLYVLEWAKDNSKFVGKCFYKLNKFPIHLFLEGEMVGFTDLTDRIGKKYSFKDFIDFVDSQRSRNDN